MYSTFQSSSPYIRPMIAPARNPGAQGQKNGPPNPQNQQPSQQFQPGYPSMQSYEQSMQQRQMYQQQQPPMQQPPIQQPPIQQPPIQQPPMQQPPMQQPPMPPMQPVNTFGQQQMLGIVDNQRTAPPNYHQGPPQQAQPRLDLNHLPSPLVFHAQDGNRVDEQAGIHLTCPSQLGITHLYSLKKADPKYQDQGPVMKRILGYISANSTKGMTDYSKNPYINTPPLATSTFRSYDTFGSSNPKIIRMVVNKIPNSESLSKLSKLPLAAVVQPFATLDAEEAVPTTDESSLVRCSRCNAYINLYFIFTNGGKNFKCNICSFINETPNAYFCNLGTTGMREDAHLRPELRNGTVDFPVGNQFTHMKPVPATHLFCIDVTAGSTQSLLKELCVAIKASLEGFLANEDPTQDLKVGFVCFDYSVYYFDLKSKAKMAKILVVSDSKTVFAPLHPEGLYISLKEYRENVFHFLDQLPNLFLQNKITMCKYGGLLQSIAQMLEGTGGKVMVFLASFPGADHDPGMLKARDEQKVCNTEDEINLYSPQNKFYLDMATKMSKGGISIDQFIFPRGTINLSSLNTISSVTGGNIHYYKPVFPRNTAPANMGMGMGMGVNPAYNLPLGTSAHGPSVAPGPGQGPASSTPSYMMSPFSHVFSFFQNTLLRTLKEPFAYDLLVKIRTSESFQVCLIDGNFTMDPNGTQFNVGGMDSKYTFMYEIKRNGETKGDAAFTQVALLYTTSCGHRRVRVINMRHPFASNLAEIYQSSDIHALVTYYLRVAAKLFKKSFLKEARQRIIEAAVEILTNYKAKATASGSVSPQLVLPETLKLLVVYINCIFKSPLFAELQDKSVDTRIYQFAKVAQMNAKSVAYYLYGRLFDVSDLQCISAVLQKLPVQVSQQQKMGSSTAPHQADILIPNNILPSTVRLAVEFLKPENAYILFTDDQAILYLGQSLAPQWIKQVFGVESTSFISNNLNEIPNVSTSAASATLQSFIELIEYEQNTVFKVSLARQGVPHEEHHFKTLLKEEKSPNTMSYVDFAFFVHRNIQDRIKAGNY